MSHGTELIIPVLPETTDKGISQETIERQMEPTPFLPATRTDVPAMIVQTDTTIAEPFLADRIERTADRLTEMGTLKCTKTTLADDAGIVTKVVIASEHAILAAYYTGNKIAVTIDVGHTLTVDNSL